MRSAQQLPKNLKSLKEVVASQSDLLTSAGMKANTIDYGGIEIGAVVIVESPPPDYYYFNGKDIGKEKFEILKKENPQYQYFSFYGKEAEVISKDSFIDTLYLMYSK